MNQLITATQLTMSTREIASLLGKKHSNIKVSAERLAENGTIALQGSKFEHNGNTYEEYLLDKRSSVILVAQNCPEFTAAIVDRWQWLESQQAPKIPQTYAAALIEAGRLALEVEKQAEQLAIAAPKVAFVDNCVERSTLLTASQVAQKHKMSAIKLNKFLDELGGVYNKGVKRGRIFCQPFIDKGYGELKQTELGHSQALFTTLGEQWINEKLISEGVI